MGGFIQPAATRSGICLAFAAAGLIFLLNASPAAAAGEVSVRGNEFLRDGKPWIAKGVGIVGRTAPAEFTKGKGYLQARNQFGAEELESVRQFGANVIRFQVSQGGSDPQSSIYSADYLKEVLAAVKMARDAGFSVIVCVDSQRPSGLDETGMPNAKAERAWRSLAPLFAKDRGIMLELFNEPAPKGPDAAPQNDWPTWRAGMQPIVDAVRQAGARNVILADGLDWARMLNDAPALSDPLSQFAYAVHPYYASNFRVEADWDNIFGRFAATHPVMATEWNVNFRKVCNPDVPQFARGMVEYLKSKRIGLVEWAYDFPRTIFVADYRGPLTTLQDVQCGNDSNSGVGELVAGYFKDASRL